MFLVFLVVYFLKQKKWSKSPLLQDDFGVSIETAANVDNQDKHDDVNQVIGLN
jgi:hypothetical protein